MTDDGIGRLLVVSLHQSISEVLPARLDYYEHWLSPMGLREGRGGLAPLGAVLSFLRQEGQPAYAAVMQAAGRASAEWHHAERGRGRSLPWAPRTWRRRAALKQVKPLLTAAYQSHVVSTDIGRGGGTVAIGHCIFCTLRDPWPWPTCTYVAAAVGRHLELLGHEATVRITACLAEGAPRCTLSVDFTGVTGSAVS